MILIISHKEDFTTDFVIQKLNDRHIEYFRLNCEDIIHEKYLFNSLNKFAFIINGNSSFKSVWFRRTKLPNLDIEDEHTRIYLLGDYEALLENICSLIDSKKWLSHPKSIYAAESKLYQLKCAQEIGFNLPDTLLSNSHDLTKEFIKKHNQDVIVKPIRQGRILREKGFETIFTNQLDSELILNLEDFDLTPCIIQENITKEFEIRITVVGDKAFSAKVDSQKTEETKTDWRKKKTSFEVYELPMEIETMCINLVKRLGLSFGAIDMIKQSNGDYTFLEINPNGQWAWLESELGLPISEEIISFLVS